MNKTAAIGLSVNMLVVVIISIVVLGAGITLVYQFVGGANQIKDDLDTRTQQELERLLVDQGKKVALPLHTATIQAGNQHVFGIGILNIGTVDENNFQLSIELSKAVDSEGIFIPGIDATTLVDEWVIYDDTTLPIKEHEHHADSILVKVPDTAEKGQYIFNAKVTALQEARMQQYGTTQKFIVTVE